MEHWQGLWLVLLFVLTFLGNGVVPLPITAYVLWLGQFHMSEWVIITGTLGTVLGWISMEGWLRTFFQKKPRLQQTIPAHMHQFFMRQPGFFIFLFNALPFPFDPIRFLALMNPYGKWRLATFLGLGRMIRYTLLVYLGATLTQHQSLFGFLLGAMLLVPCCSALVKRSQKSNSVSEIPRWQGDMRERKAIGKR